MVNDFGSVNIDADLIASRDAETISLANGCICCTMASGFLEAIWKIQEMDPAPDAVIVEASGIADPAAIAHHALTPGFDLDGVVVLLDAETVRRRERHPVVGRTIRRQLAAADVLVLNKIDLVTARELAELDLWLGHVAPGVPVLHARDGRVPLAALTGLEPAEPRSEQSAERSHDHVSASVTFDEPLTRPALDELLDGLPAGMMRVKGIVRLADDPNQRTIVHRVASRRSVTSGGPWRTGESSRLVFIALVGSLAAEALAQGPPIQLSDPAAGQ
jgi:G3E family GTPase